MKLISFGTTRLLKEKFVGKSPILSANINKPSRAVWACEYIPNIDNKEYHFHSEWEAWCVRESFHMDTLETGVIFESAFDAERKLNLRKGSINRQIHPKCSNKHCTLPDGTKIHFKYIWKD